MNNNEMAEFLKREADLAVQYGFLSQAEKYGQCAEALRNAQSEREEELYGALKALLDQASAIHGDDLCDLRTIERARRALLNQAEPPRAEGEVGETPRTDAQVSVHDEADPSVEKSAGYNDLLDHARQLERELNAALKAQKGEG